MIRLHNLQDAESFGKMLHGAARNIEILLSLLRGHCLVEDDLRRLLYAAGHDITRACMHYEDFLHDEPAGSKPAAKWGLRLERAQEGFYNAVEAFIEKGRVMPLRKVVREARALGVAFLGKRGTP